MTSPEPVKLLREAVNALDQAQERLEYRIRGAYRAGYDYFYLARKRAMIPIEPEEPQDPPPKYKSAPSDERVPPFDTDRYIVTRYDLKDLDPDEYRELVHGDRDVMD